MPKFWIFRGKGEFFLAVLAVSIPSYYGYTIYKESKFNTSIVDHSISLLSKHPDVKQVLGSPLYYKSSTGSDHKKEENMAYYSFRVAGPRGNLPVEVSAAAMTLADVYNPKFLEEQHSQIQQIESEIAGVKALPQTEETSKQILALQANADSISRDLNNKKRELHSKFYIVEDKNMESVIDNRKEDSNIPEDWKVWAITNLHLNMPNGNKVIVIPSEYTKTRATGNEAPKWTYKSIYQKLNELPENLSDEEIQEYTKQKSMNIYGKYNTHRFVTFLFLGCAAMGALWYKSKYTLSPITNTTLSYLAKTRFSSNAEVQKLGKYFVTNNIEGGRKGSVVNAKIKVEGPKKSYIHVLGKYEDDGTYRPESMQFVVEDEKGQVERRVDLK